MYLSGGSSQLEQQILQVIELTNDDHRQREREILSRQHHCWKALVMLKL